MNNDQKLDLLFKKYLTSKAAVNKATPNAYFAETYSSRPAISADQVWVQSKSIPTLNNPLNKNGNATTALRTGVDVIRQAPGTLYNGLDTGNNPVLLVNGKAILQRIDIPLHYLPNTTYSFGFTGESGTFDSVFGTGADKQPNIVPFSYEPTGLYTYQLYKNITTGVARTSTPWGTDYALSTEIEFLSADWFFDSDSLVLSFLSPAPIVPTSGVVYVRAYRYVGEVGVFGGPGGTGGIGEWQDSVFGTIKAVSTSAELDGLTALLGVDFGYATAALSNGGIGYVAGDIIQKISDNLGVRYSKFTLSDRGRFLVNQGSIPAVPVYDVNLQTTGNATVNDDAIIEYWQASARGGVGQNGFVVTAPSTGYFTSIDAQANLIIRFTGTDWIEYSAEGGYASVSNKDMIPGADTVNDADMVVVDPLAITPVNGGYVDVLVNGVNVKLGDNYTALNLPSCVFAKSIGVVSNLFTPGPTNVISFAAPHGVVAGDTIVFTGTVTTVVNSINVTRQVFAAKTIVAADLVSSTQINIGTAAHEPGRPIFRVRSFAAIQQGDVLLWFKSNAKYNLDTTDRVTYQYIVSQ